MREFFRPFRRKLGAVTLMMACALTGLWVRSVHHLEVVFVRSFCAVCSGGGGFAISQKLKYEFSSSNDGNQTDETRGTVQIGLQVSSFTSTFKLLAFDPSRTEIVDPKLIPYPWIVLPLVSISGWLLLSRTRTPRRATQA